MSTTEKIMLIGLRVCFNLESLSNEKCCTKRNQKHV